MSEQVIWWDMKLDLPGFHYLDGESEGQRYFTSHCKYSHLAYILSQYSCLVSVCPILMLIVSHQLTYAREAQ